MAKYIDAEALIAKHACTKFDENDYIDVDDIRNFPAADVVEVPPELKQVVADLIQEYKDYDMLTPDAALGKALNAVKVNYNLGKYYILNSQS